MRNINNTVLIPVTFIFVSFIFFLYVWTNRRVAKKKHTLILITFREFREKVGVGRHVSVNV